jgi:hypothetical protein
MVLKSIIYIVHTDRVVNNHKKRMLPFRETQRNAGIRTDIYLLNVKASGIQSYQKSF